MARRSRSKGSRSAGIFLFLLGLFVGAGVLYVFSKSSGRGTDGAAPPASTPAEPAGEAPRASRPARHRPAATVASDHVEPDTPAAAPVAETLPRRRPGRSMASAWRW